MKVDFSKFSYNKLESYKKIKQLFFLLLEFIFQKDILQKSFIFAVIKNKELSK